MTAKKFRRSPPEVFAGGRNEDVAWERPDRKKGQGNAVILFFLFFLLLSSGRRNRGGGISWKCSNSRGKKKRGRWM
jgi:hypothetical protein